MASRTTTHLACLALAAILLLSSCSVKNDRSSPAESIISDPQQMRTSEEIESSEREMNLYIDGNSIPVIWEDNESVKELMRLAENGLTIKMSKYGGFEQVGRIGSSITRNDIQTTTRPGDIMLYSGNQIVMFYVTNSWAYTRLGRLDLTEKELTELLSGKDIEIELKVE